MIDELGIAIKAREFIKRCGPLALPVSVDAYALQIGGEVLKEALEENEDAWSFRDKGGKYRICVNCAHNARRQRFSVCHEVAHIVLEIASDHAMPSWSYSRRPPGEIACDVFAAELLLPYQLFKPRVDSADMSIAAIDSLADEFDASLISTGSRFATFSRELCAFVVSEGGKVRYSGRSTRLREAKGWIRPGSPLPSDSYSARVRAGEKTSGAEDADPDSWFEDLARDGALFEDALHLGHWDQTLTLLWSTMSSCRRQLQSESSGTRTPTGCVSSTECFRGLAARSAGRWQLVRTGRSQAPHQACRPAFRRAVATSVIHGRATCGHR